MACCLFGFQVSALNKYFDYFYACAPYYDSLISYVFMLAEYPRNIHNPLYEHVMLKLMISLKEKPSQDFRHYCLESCH